MSAPNNQNNQLAIVKKGTVDVVAAKVREFQESKELHLPAGYSPENALKSAFLILQDTVDKSNAPVLQSCTHNSIANSLFDMVVQGLNPAKKQCYFIAYGKNLVCQRSYFGTMAVAKTVDPRIDDIVAEVVYHGDKLTYKIDKGKKVVTGHEQALENIDGSKIIAAYCMVLDKNGEVMRCEIMTMEQIKQAWKQSKMYPVADDGQIKAGSTHGKFAAEMAMKTVINKTCKPIINSSSDNHLLVESVRRADESVDEAEFAEEVADNANGEVIDIEPVGGGDSDTPEDGSNWNPSDENTLAGAAASGGPGF